MRTITRITIRHSSSHTRNGHHSPKPPPDTEKSQKASVETELTHLLSTITYLVLFFLLFSYPLFACLFFGSFLYLHYSFFLVLLIFSSTNCSRNYLHAWPEIFPKNVNFLRSCNAFSPARFHNPFLRHEAWHFNLIQKPPILFSRNRSFVFRSSSSSPPWLALCRLLEFESS